MKRQEFVKGGAALVAAAAVAVTEMQGAGAAPSFPRGADCQHNHQCKSGCCKGGVCKKPKRCKHNGGTP